MPNFQMILSHYPTSDPCDATDAKGQLLFRNQCAIRLSHALKKSGVNFDSFPRQRKCWVHPNDQHVLSARELADWIQKQGTSIIQSSEDITGERWRDKAVGRTGIICFEGYYAPDHGSAGDHIDLWNGNSLTGLGSWLRTRFSIVVPGYWSDFRKAKRIRFLIIK